MGHQPVDEVHEFRPDWVPQDQRYMLVSTSDSPSYPPTPSQLSLDGIVGVGRGEVREGPWWGILPLSVRPGHPPPCLTTDGVLCQIVSRTVSSDDSFGFPTSTHQSRRVFCGELIGRGSTPFGSLRGKERGPSPWSRRVCSHGSVTVSTVVTKTVTSTPGDRVSGPRPSVPGTPSRPSCTVSHYLTSVGPPGRGSVGGVGGPSTVPGRGVIPVPDDEGTSRGLDVPKSTLSLFCSRHLPFCSLYQRERSFGRIQSKRHRSKDIVGHTGANKDVIGVR